MKTIAAAAIVAILSAPTLAADDKSVQTTDTATPIVLSATQLDGVTAGTGGAVPTETLSMNYEEIEGTYQNEWKYVSVRR